MYDTEPYIPDLTEEEDEWLSTPIRDRTALIAPTLTLTPGYILLRRGKR